MIILEENFKWHLEAFASELLISCPTLPKELSMFCGVTQSDVKCFGGFKESASTALAWKRVH